MQPGEVKAQRDNSLWRYQQRVAAGYVYGDNRDGSIENQRGPNGKIKRGQCDTASDRPGDPGAQ
jgi:hypothetical protein